MDHAIITTRGIFDPDGFDAGANSDRDFIEEMRKRRAANRAKRWPGRGHYPFPPTPIERGDE